MSSPEYMRAWRERNKEKIKAYQKQWYAERGLEYHRRWRSENPESVSSANRRCRTKHREVRNADKKMKRYGVSAEQFTEMMERQGGVCAICGERETRTIKGTVASLCIDHDHDTGDVRSLLCHRCNRSIGAMGDDAGLLQSAADYLYFHKAKRKTG